MDVVKRLAGRMVNGFVLSRTKPDALAILVREHGDIAARRPREPVR
jgi:hypothetical protein